MQQIELEDLGIIRFTSIPDGGAPEQIRKEWVGLEVPCLFFHNGVTPEGGGVKDAVSGFDVPDYPSYIVLQTHALDALRKKSLMAAEYWEVLGFPQHQTALFQFNLESAEVVKPVMTRTELLEHYADA